MIEITVSQKNSIVVESPVLLGSGAVGYDGAPYRNLLALDKFGALVTPSVSLKPRYPAKGTRVVPMPSGFLLHTGLPNPGLSRIIHQYEDKWRRSVLPIIVHLATDDAAKMETLARMADQCDHISGLEIGFHDEVTIREMREILVAAHQNTELPLLVRLPLYNALMLSEVAQLNHAHALVVAAPPRGTERDQKGGRLVGGRLYGPWLKAQALRVVGRIKQYADVPIIGVGGIHTPDDARDFITAGATAIQLDTVVWVAPKQAERIARDLGGTELTRTAGALADEWQTEADDTQPKPVPPPDDLPEMPPEDGTHDADQANWFENWENDS